MVLGCDYAWHPLIQVQRLSGFLPMVRKLAPSEHSVLSRQVVPTHRPTQQSGQFLISNDESRGNMPTYVQYVRQAT